MHLTKTFNSEVTNKQIIETKSDMQKQSIEIIKNTIVADIHEQGRAILTKTALDNIGALSALENYLNLVAPSGQERYKQIVDAYALGAAQKIWRW